jgi:hypothetical protein
VAAVGSDHSLIQVAASNLRFGDGVTREVGMDLKNMKATKVSFAFGTCWPNADVRNAARWLFLQTPTLPIFSL